MRAGILWVCFVFSAMTFLTPMSAVAQDLSCIRTKHDALIEARQGVQRLPLSRLEGQTDAVKRAVDEEVEYQLAYIALEKTAFDAILRLKPNMLRTTQTLGNIMPPYLTQRCIDLAEDKCLFYVLEPHKDVVEALLEDEDFQSALRLLNSLNQKRQEETDEEKLVRVRNRGVIYTRDLLKSMFQDANGVGDMAGKTLEELGCR